MKSDGRMITLFHRDVRKRMTRLIAEDGSTACPDIAVRIIEVARLAQLTEDRLTSLQSCGITVGDKIWGVDCHTLSAFVLMPETTIEAKLNSAGFDLYDDPTLGSRVRLVRPHRDVFVLNNTILSFARQITAINEDVRPRESVCINRTVVFTEGQHAGLVHINSPGNVKLPSVKLAIADDPLTKIAKS